MATDDKLVLTETRGTTGIIRLNRPAKHNALSLDLMYALGDEIKRFGASQEIRAVILTGSDAAFSTGADLTEALKATTPRDALGYAGVLRTLGQIIERAPIPVIAAISGWCITGGLELALMCDIRLAAPNAVFGITSAKIGSVAGGGGTQRLPRIIGAARAKELLFTCDYIDAFEASRIGLVNRVVEVGTVLDAALEIARKVGERGPLSIGWLKSAVDTGMNMDLQSALTYEAHLCASAFMTEDRGEGMRAFLEKRQAVFTGR